MRRELPLRMQEAMLECKSFRQHNCAIADHSAWIKAHSNFVISKSIAPQRAKAEAISKSQHIGSIETLHIQILFTDKSFKVRQMRVQDRGCQLCVLQVPVRSCSDEPSSVHVQYD